MRLVGVLHERKPMLEIHSKRIPPDVIVLELAGRIVLGHDAQHLEWMGTALVRDKEKKVVLDLTNVSRVDSTGVGIIMMVCGLLKQSGGELRLAGAQGLVEDVLKLTNVHNIVALHPSAEAAAASFGMA
ncbi:MAG TPA: STAS domain-containing protein [Terriglobales bacterium]|nr:STAS domain-containing protein [Terriglobales bacterium]